MNPRIQRARRSGRLWRHVGGVGLMGGYRGTGMPILPAIVVVGLPCTIPNVPVCATPYTAGANEPVRLCVGPAIACF